MWPELAGLPPQVLNAFFVGQVQHTCHDSTKSTHNRRYGLFNMFNIGSAGLGLVIARRLTEHHNFIVAINYASNTARANAAIAQLPKGCVALQADVSKRDECLNLVKEAHEKLGGLDLVVA